MSPITQASDKSEPLSFERNLLVTAKGGGLITAGRMFAYANRFLIAFLLARLLGAEQYGLNNLALSIAAIVASLSLFGLDDAVIRYVAVLASKVDEDGLWGTLQIGVGLSVLISLILAAGLYLLAYPISVHWFQEPDLAPLLRAVSLFIPFLTLSTMLSSASLGLKKVEYAVITENFAQLLIRLLLIGILSLLGLDALRSVIVFGLSDLAASIILLYFLNKRLPLRRAFRPARYDFKKIFAFSIPLWFSGLLSTFRNNIQTMLLGTLNTVIGVGIFSVADRITLLGTMIFNGITTSTKPVIAELHARGEREQLHRIYQTSSRWAFTLYLPVFLALVLYPAAFLAIFGKSFIDGALALTILACGDMANISTGVCGSMIDMSGHSKLKLFNSIAQVSLMVGLNLLLIPRWGIVGAATAAVVGIATINLLRVSEVWYLLRMLPYSKGFLKPVVAGLVTLVFALLIERWYPTGTGFFSLVVHIALLFSVYIGLTLLMGLSREDHFVLQRLKGRLSSAFSQSRATLSRLRTAR